MVRLEQFQSHLLADAELKTFVGGRIVAGALQNTPLPAIAVNWLNRPYDDQGVIVLDAEEPQGEMHLQIDGWVHGEDADQLEAARKAKAQVKELADHLERAISKYRKEACSITRRDLLCANQNGDKRRASINVVMTAAGG